jgi:hypothetical protein
MARRTETELKEAIANLEQILDAGATTVAQDGSTTVFDLDAAERRLRGLKVELAQLQGRKPRRPLFNRINLT